MGLIIIFDDQLLLCRWLSVGCDDVAVVMISNDYRWCVDVGGGVGDYVAGTSYIRQPTWIRLFFLARHFSRNLVFFHDI